MTRARILHCLPWLASGGVERRRLELARRLSADVYEQRVVCLRAKPDLRTRFERAGVVVEEVGEPIGARALARTAHAARAFRPDLVHGAVFEGVTMANVAALASRAPRLIVEEIDYPIHRSPRGNLLFRVLAHRADRCVAVSPSVLEYLTGRARIPEHKARLIMNGAAQPHLVDPARRAEVRASLGVAPHDFLVGSIGRLFDGHKRFSDLIRAIALLASEHPKPRLLIVGDGPDRQALEELARTLGVDDRVHFAGYQSDVGPMLSSMDLFALASERESFGLVLVEAMFAGLAVVGTATFGIRDIVVHEETGLLVPVSDPPALANAIAQLQRDDERRRAFGEAGRLRAEAHFGAARYVKDVDALYREVLQLTPGPTAQEPLRQTSAAPTA